MLLIFNAQKIKQNNEDMINLVKNLKGNKNEFNLNMVTFKKRLSIFLCVIYLILFLNFYFSKYPYK